MSVRSRILNAVKYNIIFTKESKALLVNILDKVNNTMKNINEPKILFYIDTCDVYEHSSLAKQRIEPFFDTDENFSFFSSYEDITERKVEKTIDPIFTEIRIVHPNLPIRNSYNLTLDKEHESNRAEITLLRACKWSTFIEMKIKWSELIRFRIQSARGYSHIFYHSIKKYGLVFPNTELQIFRLDGGISFREDTLVSSYNFNYLEAIEDLYKFELSQEFPFCNLKIEHSVYSSDDSIYLEGRNDLSFFLKNVKSKKSSTTVRFQTKDGRAIRFYNKAGSFDIRVEFQLRGTKHWSLLTRHFFVRHSFGVSTKLCLKASAGQQ